MKKIAGYWYSEMRPEYPKPIVNSFTIEESKDFADKLIRIQALAEPVYYRGFSCSRIDKTIVGSIEYYYGDWSWPESLLPHYIEKYNVKPDNEFIEFINQEYDKLT